jgi:hypothetical protein
VRRTLARHYIGDALDAGCLGCGCALYACARLTKGAGGIERKTQEGSFQHASSFHMLLQPVNFASCCFHLLLLCICQLRLSVSVCMYTWQLLIYKHACSLLQAVHGDVSRVICGCLNYRLRKVLAANIQTCLLCVTRCR